MPIVFTVAAFAAALLLWASARAAITVCVLEVTGGKIEVRRGAISPRVLSDLEDVIERPRVAQATLRILRNAGHAKLEIKGALSEEQKQRLRNVVGAVPLAKLANGRRPR